MADSTASESIPYSAQTLAMSLASEIFAARNPLFAYLIISASAIPVSITGGSSARSISGSNTPRSASRARSVPAPRTTLSGLRKSATALPSRRNSGFIPTWRSSPRVSPDSAATVGAITSSVVVGTTVLFVTTTWEPADSPSAAPSDRAPACMIERSM
jgi:hypothetical protein